MLCEKMQKVKVGKLYQIYSPSLDAYYIGSTFNSLALRKAIHRHHSKLFDGGKFNKVTSHEIVKRDDAVYSIIREYEFINKKDLLEEEKKQILYFKTLYGDRVLNKNGLLTLNRKQYNKEQCKKYYEKHKEERSIYFKERYKKMKEERQNNITKEVYENKI